jgi:uncharacterized protein (TIGR01244 family)
MSLNLQPIDDGVYAGPQLQPAHMQALAEAGIRSVINNRPDYEEGPQQPTSQQLEAAARAAGLEYAYLPVPPGGHSEAEGRQMTALVDRLPKPVLAFCRSGRRSTALYGLGRSLGE